MKALKNIVLRWQVYSIHKHTLQAKLVAAFAEHSAALAYALKYVEGDDIDYRIEDGSEE